MNIQSFTFQSSKVWNSSIENDFIFQSLGFFESLKKNHSILGCLQSFTFPAEYTEDTSVQVAHAVSTVYQKVGCVLLGGDTSSGDSLVITLVALIK